MASWRARLRLRDTDGPTAALLEVLAATIAELSQPGVAQIEVSRSRALIYACATALAVVEAGELAAVATDLAERLAIVGGGFGRHYAA